MKRGSAGAAQAAVAVARRGAARVKMAGVMCKIYLISKLYLAMFTI